MKPITKSKHLAKPLVGTQVSFNIHIPKDHNMKKRLCLVVERLGLSARLQHCVCPLMVVRYNQYEQENAAVKTTNIHIPKHHNTKKRLRLAVERLGLNAPRALRMGCKGIRASRRRVKGNLVVQVISVCSTACIRWHWCGILKMIRRMRRLRPLPAAKAGEKLQEL